MQHKVNAVLQHKVNAPRKICSHKVNTVLQHKVNIRGVWAFLELMLSIKEAVMKLRALIPFFILVVAVAGCGRSPKDAGMTEPAVQAEETVEETGSTPADLA